MPPVIRASIPSPHTGTIDLGPLTIHMYGLMLLLAIAGAIWLWRAGFDLSGPALAWFGVLAPAGTPKEIVNRLSAEIAKIARSPEMRERLTSLGAEAVGSTPEEFAAVIARDIAKWTALSKSVGIKVD